MQHNNTATAGAERTDTPLTKNDAGVVVIATTDVRLPKPMVGLWIEMVVHATAALHEITGEQNRMVDECARVEKDGSLTFLLKMPKGYGEVSMNIPMGKWAYRNVN